MQTRDTLYIGGEWVAPASTNVIEVVSPTTEEVIGRVPEAAEGDVDRAVEAAKAALAGPYPAADAGRAGRVLRKLSLAIQARSQEMADVITAEMGSPVELGAHGPGVRSHHGARRLGRPGRDVPVRGDPPRRPRPRARAQGAGRRGGRDHPVERAAVHRRPQAGRGAGRGVADGPQAVARDPARRLHPGRDPRRGRAAQGHGVDPAGRPRGRRVPRPPPRRRQGRLHRLDRRRPQGRRHLRRAAQALHAGAGRQVGGDHPRRRRPRRGDPAAHAVGADEQRRGVRRPDPHPRSPGPLRRGRRRGGRGRAGPQGGRPHRPDRRRRPARRRAPAGPGARLHRQGPGRGRHASPSAAAGPPASTRAGSSSRRCSPTSTTA